MKHSMRVNLFFENREQSEKVLEAVTPDFRKSFKRSKSELSINGNCIEIEISAVDLTALRASFNSVMKSIAVSGNVLNAFEARY